MLAILNKITYIYKHRRKCLENECINYKAYTEYCKISQSCGGDMVYEKSLGAFRTL